MENLENDFERAQYLQNLLINLATGGQAENSEYQELRQYFLDNLQPVYTTVMGKIKSRFITVLAVHKI